MSKYPESEYSNTQNTSIRQQTEANYPKREYSHTQNMSMAGKLIRAQSEQIRGRRLRSMWRGNSG